MNTEQDRANLLPCPFCGGTNIEIQISTPGREGVPTNLMCSDCGASGPWEYEQGNSHAKADDAWNRRAALAAQAHEAAPAAQQPATCQGTNCGATSGQEHSPECILEAAEVQGWSDSPEADNARRMLAAPRDSLHDCALGDSNYAAGMLLGWNLCTDGRDEDFRRIREDRLRAAASASKEAQESAPQPAQQPLTESAIQQIGLDMPSLLHPGGLIEFARAIERAHGITED